MKIDQILLQVNKALENGILPELCEEGEGGTYFMKDEQHRRKGVFKPQDEEPLSLNNPKKLPAPKNNNVNNSVNCNGENNLARKGIRIGEAAIREVAAYVLDKEHFSGVPVTFLAECKLPFWKNSRGEVATKLGSFQKYEEHDCASWDVGSSLFAASEVHKIGILDLRIFNTDRHGGNILVKRKSSGDYNLIPIDHGFCLPDELSEAWFEWLTWNQAKVPFDERTLKYIDSLDINEDAEKLRALGIREECIRTLKISTLFLKKGASKGLTLFEIASSMCRKDLKAGSLLETIVEKVEKKLKEEKKPFEYDKQFFELLQEQIEIELAVL
jgi:hypothetical protein